MDAIFSGVGLRLVERHDAPWFALSGYEGLQRARYALRVFARAADRAADDPTASDRRPAAI